MVTAVIVAGGRARRLGGLDKSALAVPMRSFHEKVAGDIRSASYTNRIAPRLKARIDAGLLRVTDAVDEVSVLEIGPDELASFDPAERLLLNVNTPDDYARARAALQDET